MKHTRYPAKPVLLVDDERTALQSYEIVLRSSGITNVVYLDDSRQVLPFIERTQVEVILLDLIMPHVSGEEILQSLKEEYPEIPVIIVTGANDVDTAVKCMKMDAFDYMVKPVERNRLVSGVKRAIELRDLRRETSKLKQQILTPQIKHPDAFSDIISNSTSMRSIFQYVEAVAGTNHPVLITGETGVGKELMAKAIHRLSNRRGSFIAINIAGLDDTVFADTLFGHRPGAFTSADQSRSGLLEKASGGTLFLDEIGDLSVTSQLKLLRLLQEHEYFPLGSDVPRRSDARIIVSTNQDLHALMESGTFRKDLYYRLRIHHVHIPPLRERKNDIPLLVEYFIEQAAQSLEKKKPTPPPELFTLLRAYHFPGNIRELQGIVFDAVSKHTSGKLSLDVFRNTIFEHHTGTIAEEPERYEHHKPDITFGEELPTLKELDMLLIEEAMRRAGNNQSIAARMLGISQQALSKRLKRAGKKK